MFTKFICTRNHLRNRQNYWCLYLTPRSLSSLVWDMGWLWNFYKILGFSNGQKSLEKAPMPLPLWFLSLWHLPPLLQIPLWLWPSSSLSWSPSSLWQTSTSFAVQLKRTFDFLCPGHFCFSTGQSRHLGIWLSTQWLAQMCWGRMDTSLHDLPGHSDWFCNSWMNEWTNEWVSEHLYKKWKWHGTRMGLWDLNLGSDTKRKNFGFAAVLTSLWTLGPVTS